MVLLAVLAGGVWLVVSAFAAAAPPAPSLTETPNTSPTNQTSETFNYSDTQSGVTFSCTLDGVAKTCPGTTSGSATFNSLPQGSHTFSISAVASSKTSSATTYTWTVDTTAPTLTGSGIVRADANPTNASALHWTVTFSEPVKNVVLGDFGLATSGLGGSAPSLSSVVAVGSSPATSWTVTALTTGTTASSGSIGLNLTSKGTITDAAGNALVTTPATPPVVGQSYTFDTTPPPAPSISNTSAPANGGLTNQNSTNLVFSDSEGGVSLLCSLDSGSYTACSSPKNYTGLADGSHTFTVKAQDGAGNLSAASSPVWSWTLDTTPPPKPSIVGPNNNNPSTVATFTFTDSEAGVSFKCQMDGGGYTPCTSPKSYPPLPPGTHVFDAEPIDPAGNIGPYNEWKWTISGLSGSGMPFSIAATIPTLYPGPTVDKLNLSLTNPNSVTIYVTNLTVNPPSITTTHAGPNPCTAADFQVTQFSGTYPIAVPPGGPYTLYALGYTDNSKWPSIQMLDRQDAHPGDHSGNQDRCQGASLSFPFTGTAQS